MKMENWKPENNNWIAIIFAMIVLVGITYCVASIATGCECKECVCEVTETIVE